MEVVGQLQLQAQSPGFSELQYAALEPQLDDAAVASLSDAALQRDLMNALLQTVYVAPELPHGQRACSLLFQLACACNGTEIKVRQGGTTPPVGVLILGYAGSSLKTLVTLQELYGEWRPHWRIATTIGSGLESEGARAALDRQMAELERLMRPCGAIVVHAMSNNGHGLWARLLHAYPELGARTACVVYDCAAFAPVAGMKPAPEVR
jgi:hypothetical protein